MSRQTQNIQHFSAQLTKVIASHGADSDYTAQAFFNLQAARMGIPLDEAFKWAESEMARLKAITLNRL